MNKILSTLSFGLSLGLGCSLVAQGGTVPPGYDTVDSGGTGAYAYLLGYYQEMRAQISNADLTGKGPIVMKEISFRQDASVSSSSAVDRSWSNVAVQLGETDYAGLTSTWAANFVQTPTAVFSASHNWPSLTTQPSGSPNPWDNGGLKFPFSTSFIYTGAKDLLLDMTFLGGTLGNGAAWGPGSANGKGYYLDGRSVVTSAGGSLNSGGLNVQTNPCAADSSYTGTSTLGPNSYFWHWSYAKDTGSATTSDKMRYYFQLSNFPASIPVFQGVSLAGTTSLVDPNYPVVPGLGCQNLNIDLNQMFVINSFTTSTSGSANTSTSVYIPFVAAAVGSRIYTQSIWEDTVLKSAKLSRVSNTLIQPQPAAADFAGKFAYHYDPSLATSFTPSQSSVPLYRYQ